MMLCFLLLAGCDNKNIHQLVKSVAETPVDTTGFSRREFLTNEYSSVLVDCFADVTFHQTPVGTAPRVLLAAPGEVLGNISVRTREGELCIEVDRRYRMPEKAVAVVHIYAPFASKFTLNGCKCLRIGKLHTESPLILETAGVGALTGDTVSVPELSLKLKGGGSIDLKSLRTGRLKAVLDGDGMIVLQGSCTSSTLQLAGSGHIDATGLKGEEKPRTQVAGEGSISL